ncbi:MAG: hypothetical protein U0237_14855 [Thermoleophilia bacterium]
MTLTAKIGSTGESRSATGTLVVPAPAGVPAGGVLRPSVTLGVARGVTARAARSKGLPIVISSDTAGAARVTLTQIRRVRVGPRRFSSLPVQIVRRTITVRSGVTRLRIRGTGLRPGRVTVVLAGTGFSIRGATILG